MIIHLFQKEKFTLPFIYFVNSNFNKEEHLFFVFGYNSSCSNDELSKISNVITLDKTLKSRKILKQYLKQANKIIIHSLYIPNWIKAYLVMNKKVLKKSNWVIWGGDLYCYKEKRTKLKEKIEENLRKNIISNVGYVTSLVDNDYTLAKEWYGVKGRHFSGMYVNPIKLEYLDEIINKREESKFTNIQLGNSASPANNHFEAIDIISQYKEENIRVYVPLSYGDKEYALKVKDYGEKVLGEKFIALLDFMQPDEYSKFLGEIDIAIFNNNRQQALGNIFSLAYLEAKIFMRNDTTMWAQLVETENYEFEPIDVIKKITYDNFIFKDKVKLINNKRISKKRFEEKHLVNVWNNIFNNMI